MKKGVYILFIIFLAVIFQLSALPLFFSEKNIPDLVLVLSISAVVVFGFQAIWIWVILTGFILDIFSFRKIGINIFSFVIFCYSVSFFSRRLLLGEKAGGILIGTVFLLFMTFFHNLWIYLTNAQFKFQEIWKLKIVFLEALGWKFIFNLVLFFIFLLIFKKIEKNISRNKNLFTGK